jgi:hypothetical protein
MRPTTPALLAGAAAIAVPDLLSAGILLSQVSALKKRDFAAGYAANTAAPAAGARLPETTRDL